MYSMVPEPQEVRRALLERLLKRLLHPDPLYQELLQDYPRRGGKMLRGLLTYYSALAHGAPEEAALLAGEGLELFQNWVLIHDDIEDGSEERRGLPALYLGPDIPLPDLRSLAERLGPGPWSFPSPSPIT